MTADEYYLVSINEVKPRRARLVLGWVTVSGFDSRCGTFILVCDQPPRSTQPGHPFVARRNEWQPNGGKDRCVVAGKTVRSHYYTRAIPERSNHRFPYLLYLQAVADNLPSRAAMINEHHAEPYRT